MNLDVASFRRAGLRATIAFAARHAARFEHLLHVDLMMSNQHDLLRSVHTIVDRAWSFACATPNLPVTFKDPLAGYLAPYVYEGKLHQEPIRDLDLLRRTGVATLSAVSAVETYPPSTRGINECFIEVQGILDFHQYGKASFRNAMLRDVQIIEHLSSRRQVEVGGQVDPGVSGPFGPLWLFNDIPERVYDSPSSPYTVIASSVPITSSSIQEQAILLERGYATATWVLFYADTVNDIGIQHAISSANSFHSSYNRPIARLPTGVKPAYVVFVARPKTAEILDLRIMLSNNHVSLVTPEDLLIYRRIAKFDLPTGSQPLPTSLNTFKQAFEQEMLVLTNARDFGGAGWSSTPTATLQASHKAAWAASLPHRAVQDKAMSSDALAAANLKYKALLDFLQP